MIGDIPVIDGVVHGFDFNQANMLNMPPGRIHAQAHLAKTPRQAKYARYILDQDRYERKHTAEEMVSCCFAESQTDIAVYHTVRRIGYMNVGEWSPWDVGLEMRERAGHERVLIMAGLTDPFDTKRSIDELDEMIEQHHVIGLKLYPYDWDARRSELRTLLLNDEDVTFPLIEHVRSKGLRSISVHKAIGSIIECFGVTDVEAAVTTFPDMQFEIVHAGWAFMEDTAILAQRSNVWLNLEGTASLLGMAPRRFAEILGKFLQKGGGEPGAEDRIIWATGVMAVHPQPLLDLFMEFEMPEDLMEGYGYPEVTMEIKRKILAENYARKIGWDLDKMIAAIPDDEYKQRQQTGNLAEPWSMVPMEAEPARVGS